MVFEDFYFLVLSWKVIFSLLSGIVLYNRVWSRKILYEFVMSCIVLNGHVCLNAGGQKGNKLFIRLTHIFEAMASLR